jgi:putative ABC transport system permease protein
VLGTISGNLLSIPIMNRAETAFDAGTQTVAPWIDVVVPAAALVVVSATALPAALRAGRLRTVEAIAVGHTSPRKHAPAVTRLLGRLPLPRPVSLGLAMPFARPARSSITAAAVAFGTIAVTFGVGLAVSLSDIQDAVNRSSAGSVVVQAFGPPAAPPPGVGSKATTTAPRKVDPAAIAARIRSQPGTERYFTTHQTRVSVVGLTGATTVIIYGGDASWGSYQMLNGSWFHRPGEVVVPSGFLASTGTHVGDTITLANDDHTARVRIVGEAFTTREEGMLILTEASSLAGLDAYVLPESLEFDIALRPGTDQQAYLDALNAALQPLGVTAQANQSRLSGTAVAMDALATTLTAMLMAVAGLGVLNTVLLETRERVHDFGIFKALGMSPRQTVGAVITSVTIIAAVGVAFGLPVGVALHHVVLPAMGYAGGTRIPNADVAVYRPIVLASLALGGVAIAIAGALPPAGWAARTRTAIALRTE